MRIDLLLQLLIQPHTAQGTSQNHTSSDKRNRVFPESGKHYIAPKGDSHCLYISSMVSIYM